MASLSGVVEEWDASAQVRQRVREVGALFTPLPFTTKPVPTVACGELNFEVLKPIMKRLQYPVGCVGMHSVPHLERQFFSSIKLTKFNGFVMILVWVW